MTELEELKAENKQLKEAHEKCLSAARQLRLELDQARFHYDTLQKEHIELQSHYAHVRGSMCIGDWDTLQYVFYLAPSLVYTMTSEARNSLLKSVFTHAVREMQEQLLSSKF